MAKILIADDSLMMRKVARMSLEKGGHTVVEAEDGAQAVAMAKAELPHLILLDAEMPELDGFEASKAIKADPLTAAIPVLICTGHDLSEEPEALKNAGATGSITKPYNPAQLLEKVSEVLNG
jgi:CheY-like chemotaxis protein